MSDISIFILIVDALRARNLGCYGYNRDTSPNIDNIAEQGILFKNAFSASNWTIPSFYSIITGLYPSHHTVAEFNQRINPKIATLPEFVEKVRGYETFMFSNYLNLVDKNTFGNHFTDTRIINIDENLDDLEMVLSNINKPFFSIFHIGNYVHEPFIAQKEIVDRFYKPKKSRINFRRIESLISSDNSGKKMRRLTKKINLGIIRLSTAEKDYITACYDAGIRYVDSFIGRIYRFLQQMGKPLVFILTSDHGQALLEHGIIGHGLNLHNEVIKIPLIIDFLSMEGKYPRKRIYEANVGHVDFAPTLLNIMGEEMNYTDGEVIEFSRSKVSKQGNMAISERFPMVAIIKNHKLITSFYKVMKWPQILHNLLNKMKKKALKEVLVNLWTGFRRDELYQLRNDPFEQDNVIKSCVSEGRSLRELLKKRVNLSQAQMKQPLSIKLDEKVKKRLEDLGYLD